MEDLAPPLGLCILVREALESGQTISKGIRRYIEQEKRLFGAEVARWLISVEAGRPMKAGFESAHRRILLELLQSGLKGNSIYERIRDLELEILAASLVDMEENIVRTGFRAMIPLLALVFPATVWVLLGPFFLKLKGG